MTDKARELLERALECWELQLFGAANCGFNTFEEIRAYLASEKQDQPEPVAWMNGMRNLLSWDKFYEDMSPLYLHPAPQRSFVRLSEKEMQKVVRKTGICWDVARAIEDALEEKNK